MLRPRCGKRSWRRWSDLEMKGMPVGFADGHSLVLPAGNETNAGILPTFCSFVGMDKMEVSKLSKDFSPSSGGGLRKKS